MKKTIIIVVALLVVAGGSFFGGMKYGQSKVSFPAGEFSGRDFPNMINGNASSTKMQGGSFLTGEVVSKDDQSLTIKTSDGSSKIVFFSSSTAVSKTTEGSLSDIEVGKQITVSGSQNSDGSYTAKTIQER